MDGEQQQLFGAKAGDVESVHINMWRNEAQGGFTILLDVKPRMRKASWTIHVACMDTIEVNRPLTIATGIAQKAPYVSSETIKLHMQRMIQTLSREGYACQAMGLGAWGKPRP